MHEPGFLLIPPSPPLPWTSAPAARAGGARKLRGGLRSVTPLEAPQRFPCSADARNGRSGKPVPSTSHLHHSVSKGMPAEEAYCTLLSDDSLAGRCQWGREAIAQQPCFCYSRQCCVAACNAAPGVSPPERCSSIGGGDDLREAAPQEPQSLCPTGSASRGPRRENRSGLREYAMKSSSPARWPSHAHSTPSSAGGESGAAVPSRRGVGRAASQRDPSWGARKHYRTVADRIDEHLRRALALSKHSGYTSRYFMNHFPLGVPEGLGMPSRACSVGRMNRELKCGSGAEEGSRLPLQLLRASQRAGDSAPSSPSSSVTTDSASQQAGDFLPKSTTVEAVRAVSPCDSALHRLRAGNHVSERANPGNRGSSIQGNGDHQRAHKRTPSPWRAYDSDSVMESLSAGLASLEKAQDLLAQLPLTHTLRTRKEEEIQRIYGQCQTLWRQCCPARPIRRATRACSPAQRPCPPTPSAVPLEAGPKSQRGASRASRNGPSSRRALRRCVAPPEVSLIAPSTFDLLSEGGGFLHRAERHGASPRLPVSCPSSLSDATTPIHSYEGGKGFLVRTRHAQTAEQGSPCRTAGAFGALGRVQAPAPSPSIDMREVDEMPIANEERGSTPRKRCTGNTAAPESSAGADATGSTEHHVPSESHTLDGSDVVRLMMAPSETPERAEPRIAARPLVGAPSQCRPTPSETLLGSAERSDLWVARAGFPMRLGCGTLYFQTPTSAAIVEAHFGTLLQCQSQRWRTQVSRSGHANGSEAASNPMVPSAITETTPLLPPPSIHEPAGGCSISSPCDETPSQFASTRSTSTENRHGDTRNDKATVSSTDTPRSARHFDHSLDQVIAAARRRIQELVARKASKAAAP